MSMFNEITNETLVEYVNDQDKAPNRRVRALKMLINRNGCKGEYFFKDGCCEACGSHVPAFIKNAEQGGCPLCGICKDLDELSDTKYR